MASNRVPPLGSTSASTTAAGVVQLTDSTSSTSTTTASTPNAVKSAYDLANGAIAKTLTTTTGDIMYASAANTPARLGIGSSAQVLTVASGVPSWATPASTSAMTLISTTTFSGATTANIDNIFSSTYTKYKVILTRWNASASLPLHMKFRYGSTTESIANYYTTSKGINVNDTTATLLEAAGTKMSIGTETQGGGGILELTFVDIGTSAIQPYFSGIWSGMSTTTQLVGGTKNGAQQTYTGLQFLSSSGNVSGTISVYGLAS